MTKRRLLPHLRTTILTMIAALGLASGLFVATPATAHSIVHQEPNSPAVDPVPAPIAQVSVSQSTPVIAPGGEITFSTVITNVSGRTLDAGRATLSSGSLPLTGLTQASDWLTDTKDLRLPLALDSIPVPELAPGASFSVPPVTLSTEQLGLHSAAGNYAVRTHYRSGEQTAEARTSVLFDNGRLSVTGGVTLIAPITTPPGSAGLISAESLAEWTAPNAQLSRQLDRVQNRPITLAIDPMIIASIRALGTSVPESAREWLDRLGSLTNESFLLQYADADGGLQAQAGAKTLLSPTSLRYGLDPSTLTLPPEPTASPAPEEIEPIAPTLESLLDYPVTEHGLIWPAPDTTAAGDIGVFSTSGFETTILSGRQIETSSDQTSGALLGVEGHAVLSENPILSDAFRTALAADSITGQALAKIDLRRLFSALGQEKGSGSRIQLLTLPRGWADNTPGWDSAIDAVSTIPEAPVVSFAALRSQPEANATLIPAAANADFIEPAEALLTRELDILGFAPVLETPELLTGRERAQILSLFAVSWGSERARWADACTEHQSGTDATLGGITLAPTERFNMVSWQSKLGFSVRNDLPFPVNVGLWVQSDSLRLNIDSSVERAIPPFSTEKFSVPVRARIGNGEAIISLSLHGPNGVQIGPQSEVPVSVRADWETIGSIVLGSIILVLLVGGVTRTLLKRRRLGRTGSTLSRAAETDPADSKDSSL